MMEQTNISELKAEVLLNHLYPELAERWIVKNEGTFYRNYSEDVMRIDEETAKVAAEYKLVRLGNVKRFSVGFNSV